MDAVTLDRAIVGEGTLEAQWLGWGGLQRLPAVSLSQLVPAGARAVVIAPHPDDEVLAVGGLMALLGRTGAAACVVAVTDGTASHAGSTEWTAERLRRERPMESALAWQRLGIAVEAVRLGLPDGGVTAARERLVARLKTLLRPGDVMFTTWRGDGHPDHEATGEACARAAADARVRCVEVPVWAWHWASPGDARLPWHRAHRLSLDADATARKQGAVQAFASQLHADASTGAGPILRASTVARAARPFEVMFL